MIVGVPKEQVAGERRVALVPELVTKLKQAGLDVCIEAGAGSPAGFPDQLFADKGARLEQEIFSTSDIILKVQPPTAAEIQRCKEGCVLIGFLQPYAPETAIT